MVSFAAFANVDSSTRVSGGSCPRMRATTIASKNITSVTTPIPGARLRGRPDRNGSNRETIEDQRRHRDLKRYRDELTRIGNPWITDYTAILRDDCGGENGDHEDRGGRYR